MLDLLQTHPSVRFMTGSEIFDWYCNQIPCPMKEAMVD
jgi:hypothetical protein